jgi:hypothetical protein
MTHAAKGSGGKHVATPRAGSSNLVVRRQPIDYSLFVSLLSDTLSDGVRFFAQILPVFPALLDRADNQMTACRPKAATPFFEAFAKVVIYLNTEQKLFLDHFARIEAEAVNAGAVTILEFRILVLASIELVRLAILLAMHSSSGVFYHN